MARITRLMLTAILLCAAVLSCAGCTLTQAPELRVEDVSWGESSDQARLLLFEVAMINPTEPREATTASGSGGAVRLLEVHYEVQLDGQTVYRGRRDARATLAAGGDRMMTLPAVIASAESSAGSYRLSGNIRYLPDDRLSEILNDLGFEYRQTGFSEEGRVE